MQRLTVALGLHLLVGIASASADPASTQPTTAEAALNPTLLVEQFIRALQAGDAETAREMVFDFGHRDDPLLRDRLQRLAAFKWNASVRESVEKERTAVVVIVEGKARTDFDPVYLIRRDGRFFVMPGISRYSRGIAEPTDEEVAEFDALHAWFKERKAAGFR